MEERGWRAEVAEIERRRRLRERMGGADGIERQHRHGKLTARERIAAFVDDGSFREFYSLAGEGTYEGNELKSFVPRPVVEGTARVGERKIVLTAGDFTIRGGSGGGGGGMGSELAPNERAREWKVPLVRLLDAAGGSVRHFEQIGRTYLPDGSAWWLIDVDMLSKVPVVAAILGSVAGGPAIHACLAHFNVMVKDTSQLFPGGPPVVKAALGYDISKDDLGGAHIHTRVSGSVDNLANTEEEAFEMIRTFLGYLPSNVWEMPPRGPTDDDPDRRDEALVDLMPRDRRKIYDIYTLIHSVLDAGSFFEIAPRYGRARITGLGRLHGYPVGVMANNPRHHGGATDVAGGSKVMRLLQLCDVFHLPVVSLCDEPGFMVGLEAEKQGIERAGAQLLVVTSQTRMPLVTLAIGRVFGVAGSTHHRASGMFRRYAWPSATWGSMPIAGGTFAAYRREIETAPDPEAKRREIEARLHAVASPFRTAEATGQDIIDPRETRSVLCEFAEEAQRVLRTQLGEPPVPYRP